MFKLWGWKNEVENPIGYSHRKGCWMNNKKERGENPFFFLPHCQFNSKRNIKQIPIEHCHTGHRDDRLKIIIWLEKRTDIWHLVLLRKNILFKKSPLNIMVIENPNWSTKILCYMTGYVKGKMLLHSKHPTWCRLHYWFCLKLIKNLFSL